MLEDDKELLMMMMNSIDKSVNLFRKECNTINGIYIVAATVIDTIASHQ